MSNATAAAQAKKVRAYVSFRRAELEYQLGQLGPPSSIGTARHATIRENIGRSYQMLAELERFATWLEDGSPDTFTAPLSEAEKEFWVKAKSMGVETPPEIEAQL